MKSRPVEAFQVLVASQVMPASCKICRMLSRLRHAIPAEAGYSASLAKLHVLNARPRSRGQHRAIRQICRRTWSLIVAGPPHPGTAHAALEMAVLEGKLVRNVAKLVTPPEHMPRERDTGARPRSASSSRRRHATGCTRHGGCHSTAAAR